MADGNEALARMANLPSGFGAETKPAEAVEETYRFGQWQDGRTSRWVIDCAQCTRDDEGWMIRFDKELGRMVRVTFRTKAAAEAAVGEHFNGNHENRGDHG